MMHKQPWRNAAITQRVLAGEPCAPVAQDYRLTSVRILHITTATFREAYPQYRHRFGLGLARMRAIYQAQPVPLAGQEAHDEP